MTHGQQHLIRVKELAEQGLTPMEIAKELSIKKHTMYRLLKKVDFSVTPVKDKVKERDQLVCKRFLEGQRSLKDISQEFNCSIATISLTLKRNNITISTARKNEIRKRTVQKKYGVDNVRNLPRK